MFGDVGEGKMDETGKCMIYLDDMFAETIDTDVQYQVFLQAYGEGNVYVNERSPSYFAACGTPGLALVGRSRQYRKDMIRSGLKVLKNQSTKKRQPM